MRDFIEMLYSRIYNTFAERNNIIIVLLVVILCFNIHAYDKLKRKIDHRYFNTTTTIEKIHNVKINTLNGELKR